MLKRKGQNLMALRESLGDEGLCHKISELLESQDGAAPMLRPGDMSIGEIHEATRGGMVEISEGVEVSTFSIITSSLISAKVMESFNLAARAGLQLVTIMPSNLMVDKVPGAYRTSLIEKITGKGDYPKTGDVVEKYVQIEEDLWGGIIEITERIIRFDQTGLVLRNAQNIGEDMAAKQDELIINGIIDATGYEGYYPNAVKTALYSAGHKNIITNKLEDWEDISAADTKLALMQREDGQTLDIMPDAILVPRALMMKANMVCNSPTLPGAATPVNNPIAKLGLNVVQSARLDAVSTAKWYYGAFKRQFVWKEVIAPETLVKRDPVFERDISAQYKVRMDGKFGALDHRCVIYSSGTN